MAGEIPGPRPRHSPRDREGLRQPRMVEVEGLADVVAADSSICYIDGARGILSYRGIDIHELAEKSSFEEVCFLLWEGRLPRKEELARLRAEIGRERTIPQEIRDLL